MLFVDIGSTYTKLVVVDVDRMCFVATDSAPTTVSDVSVGFQNALDKLSRKGLPEELLRERYASSSAAGGLRIVAVGLVPSLTVEAAKRAALGAGAKVTKVFAFKMTRREIDEIAREIPDIILLAGGTDGGESETMLHNARLLASGGLSAPIVIAGNARAADEARDILRSSGVFARVTANVMPEVNKLCVEPVRDVIREIFIERIVVAKGLDKINSYIDGIALPTPLAVLEAAKAVQSAAGSDVLVIDVGGATTDVHSIAGGEPTDSKVLLKGLPEPFSKRTVEGDLGVRHNISSIIEETGEELFLSKMTEFGHADSERIKKTLDAWRDKTECVACDDFERRLDGLLAYCAVKKAVDRHVGRIEPMWGVDGKILVQYGKDLTNLKILIGTGGPLIHGDRSGEVLEGATYARGDPSLLKPKCPTFYVDKKYVLFSIGLLRTVDAEAAGLLANSYLKEMEEI